MPDRPRVPDAPPIPRMDKCACNPLREHLCNQANFEWVLAQLEAARRERDARADAINICVVCGKAVRDSCDTGALGACLSCCARSASYLQRAEQAEAENVRLRAALERNATVRVLCGGCGRTYLRCRECGMSAHLHDVPASDELAHDPACLLTSREPSPPPAPCTGC